MFPHVYQTGRNCGAACLCAIASYYGMEYSLVEISAICECDEHGISLHALSKAAELIGFDVMSVKTQYDKFVSCAPLPAIVHLTGDHYVVVYDINDTYVYISDPAVGITYLDINSFLMRWVIDFDKSTCSEGIALLFKCKEGDN